jgi:hypothetical protein
LNIKKEENLKKTIDEEVDYGEGLEPVIELAL